MIHELTAAKQALIFSKGMAAGWSRMRALVLDEER
jgi:hypothetical protein